MNRLLIVEDNRDDEMLILRALNARNFNATVSIARDGQEAIELLGLQEGADAVELPDAVMLDLKLPKLSGHEILERMRGNERTKAIRVLVLSSSDEAIDVESAASMGVSHMRKPNDFYAFLETVGEALDQLCGSVEERPSGQS